MFVKVHPDNPSTEFINRAAQILREGGVIIYPTDTVYGIGCSIYNTGAIDRIYHIKRQTITKPFSFLCSDLSHISEYAKVSNSAFRLMKQLIPGPYTFVLPASRLKQLPKSMISKRQEVGIRVPDHGVCRSLLKEFGSPILNASVDDGDGELINDPEQVREKYRRQVDLMLEAGKSNLGLSTVLDLTGEKPVVVREGAGDVSQLLLA